MGVVVDTELGFDIQCDTSGTFSASVYGVFYQDKSITKVRKFINGSTPAIKALVVKSDRYASGIESIYVASVQNDTQGNPLAFTPQESHRYAYRDYGKVAYEYDEQLVKAVERVVDECAKRNKITNDWYAGQMQKIVSCLRPLTPERFKELVEEARAKPHD